MQNKIVLLFLIGLASVHSQYWKLVWSDEFDGNAIDLKKWQFEENCNVKNNELQCYTAKTTNARVANGKLTITARVENYGNKKYTSARLNTAKTASWLYGRFEMSAKLPKGKHLWPAFWMLPTDYKYGTWAASGEIDIMEYRGQETNITQGTLHFGNTWPDNARQGSGSVNMKVDLSAGFHLYAVEWEKDEMRWYFDNKMFYKMSLNRSFFSGKGTNPYTANRQPFDQRFNYVINLAVGGDFFSATKYGTLTTADAQAWPDNNYVIDYIRSYEWSTSPPPTTSAVVSKAATSAVSKATTATATSTIREITVEQDSNPVENTDFIGNLESNTQDNANTKILGMSKPVVGVIFAAIGLLLIVLVVVAVVFYRRRASGRAIDQTELAQPGGGETLTSVAVKTMFVPVVGLRCQAKYSDGEFYPVTIEAVHGSLCHVNFGPEYGDEKDWIEVYDMKP